MAVNLLPTNNVAIAACHGEEIVAARVVTNSKTNSSSRTNKMARYNMTTMVVITMVAMNNNIPGNSVTSDGVLAVAALAVDAVDALGPTIHAIKVNDVQLAAVMVVWAAMAATIRTLILITGAAMVKAVKCAVVVHRDVSSVVISMVAAVDHVVCHVMTVAKGDKAKDKDKVPDATVVHAVQTTENPITAEDKTTNNNNRMLAKRFKIPLLKAAHRHSMN